MVMMGWGPSRLCLSVLINPVCKVTNQIEKEAYHLLSENASQEIFSKPGQEREVRSTSCLLSFPSSFRLKQKRLTASQHSLRGAKPETSSASLDDPPKSGLSASGLSVLHSIFYITQQAEEARCKCKNGHHKPSLSRDLEPRTRPWCSEFFLGRWSLKIPTSQLMQSLPSLLLLQSSKCSQNFST